MNHELLAILEHIEQERGISKEQLAEAVEKALLSASRKSIHPASDLTVRLDRNTGDIKAWAKLEVVEVFPNSDQIVLDEVRKKDPTAQIGDIVNWEVTPKNFGRIAAQTARQAILQQLRKAEKDIVQEEFKDKVGELISGVVRRIEAGSIIVDVQKAEGIISGKDKVPGEQYMAGERVNAVLIKVDAQAAGPSLILSRSTPIFVKRLFEREVTEIHDGVVEIVNVAREAGARTKIAVRSNDPRVDPVGACVGMRGMRVKNITNELGGERVDIIPYADDIKTYVTHAMHPAKLSKIIIDNEKKLLTIHVDQENSKLAFGRKAQNVRLAQKLTGWNINLVIDEEQQEESFEAKKAHTIEQLAADLSIASKTAETLVNNGFPTIEGLKDIQADELAKIEGITSEMAQRIADAVAKINTENGGNSAD